jgi:hypothetical protein
MVCLCVVCCVLCVCGCWGWGGVGGGGGGGGWGWGDVRGEQRSREAGKQGSRGEWRCREAGENGVVLSNVPRGFSSSSGSSLLAWRGFLRSAIVSVELAGAWKREA